MISAKDITGFFVLNVHNDLYEVLNREILESGETSNWFRVRKINKGNVEILAHEDFIREGQKCVDGSWPPNIVKRKKLNELQEMDVFA